MQIIYEILFKMRNQLLLLLFRFRFFPIFIHIISIKKKYLKYKLFTSIFKIRDIVVGIFLKRKNILI